MIQTIRNTLLELFRLLGATADSAATDVDELIKLIEHETMTEIIDGLKKEHAESIASIDDAGHHIDEESLKKLLETASSRTLVTYYAKNKKGYSENQKEIFLTFLTTN